MSVPGRSPALSEPRLLAPASFEAATLRSTRQSAFPQVPVAAVPPASRPEQAEERLAVFPEPQGPCVPQAAPPSEHPRPAEHPHPEPDTALESLPVRSAGSSRESRAIAPKRLGPRHDRRPGSRDRKSVV